VPIFGEAAYWSELVTSGVPVGNSSSIEDAIARIARLEPVHGVEQVDLSQALFRVLAEEVVAPHPIPAHDSSAVDGYAFRLSELPPDGQMPISGRVAAGHPLQGVLPPRSAVRIFTGGVVPQRADTVAMQEDCIFRDETVSLPLRLRVGENLRPAGNDVAQHTSVLSRGARLRPQDIGMAAAVGRASLLVHRRIRIAVIATGDELRPAGESLPRGCIYDSNRYAIMAALTAIGASVITCSLVPDRRSVIREALSEAARDNDLVVTSGGVSVGEEDHVRQVVQEIGSIDLWKMAIKPGRPIALGSICGTPYLGLPGNPVSAMVTFWLIGRPLVLRLMGAADMSLPRFQVISAFNHRHNQGRREYVRARVRADERGALQAEAFHSTSSGMLSSLTWSTGLVEVSEEVGDIKVGDAVQYLPYAVTY
jgi:molybdopterin molybdotransferase